MGIWDDLNPVHDVESLAHGAKELWNDVTSGANTAPVPQVNSSPPRAVQPRTWTAPDVNASGHLTVHHGALTSAADVIKNYVTDLDNAINEITTHYSSFDSLMGWDTGSSFGGNLTAAVTAFTSAGNDTSEAHASTASNLTQTAAVYSDTETTNAQLAGGSSGSSGSSGSAGSSSANGNWG